jgi:hypothetical protein
MERFARAVIEEVIKPVLDAHGLEYRGTKFPDQSDRAVRDRRPPRRRRPHRPEDHRGHLRLGWRATAAGRSAGRTRPRSIARRHTPRGGFAKNIVEAKLARRCEVQVAYAIGVARPVSILVQTFGTGVIPDGEIEKIVAEVFDLTPRGIIDALKLKRPIYGQTATYGHFGRRPYSGVYQDDGRSQKVDFSPGSEPTA